MAITWDGGDTVDCESTGTWTVTLREDGTATLEGEYTSTPQFTGGIAYCEENTTGHWDIFKTGTHANGRVWFDIWLDDDKVTLEGNYDDTALKGDYSISSTSVLPGWGEWTRSESLDLNLPLTTQ